MFICTDGGRFKSYKCGELIIQKGYLYSIDSFRCEICGKTILGGMADSPMYPAGSGRATAIIQAMADKGFNCYGVTAEEPKGGI